MRPIVDHSDPEGRHREVCAGSGVRPNELQVNTGSGDTCPWRSIADPNCRRNAASLTSGCRDNRNRGFWRAKRAMTAGEIRLNMILRKKIRRTGSFQPVDFESGASANSATSATSVFTSQLEMRAISTVATNATTIGSRFGEKNPKNERRGRITNRESPIQTPR